MTRNIVNSDEVLAEQQVQEAFSFDFVGNSRQYVDGKIVLGGQPVYGSDLMGNWSRSFEYPFVALNIPRGKKLSILDVGSGYGYFPFYLSSLGHDVTCCDITDLSVLFADTGVAFVADDITRSKNNNKYDIIYCISVLEHLEDKEAAVGCMHKMLNESGKLIVTLDCDLYGSSHGNTTPDYAQTAKLVSYLNEKFRKSLDEFVLTRNHLVTTLDYQNTKWRLPWRQDVTAAAGKPNLFDRIRFYLDSHYRKESMPCLGIFVGMWSKNDL